MNIVGVHLEPGPVGWHRCWNWTTAMQRLGHRVTHRVHESEQFDMGDLESNFKGADVVVTAKMHHARVFAAILAARDAYKFKLVVDIDDAADMTPKYNQSFDDYHPGSGLARLVKAQLRYADLVTASTTTMAAHVYKYNGHVATIPNVVDPRLHAHVRSRVKESRHQNDIRIYWGGGGGHYDDLLVVRDALLRTFKERPNIKLVFSNFIPDWAIDLPPFRVFMLRFAHFNAYPKVLKWLCADVALAPLVDNDFNRCKSHVKYLDYAMAGIPGIYSDLPPYDTVKHGVTGFKAGTSEDWYKYINLLIDDRETADRISQVAKADVFEHWTTDLYAPKYESMLREVISRKTPEFHFLSETGGQECLTA